METSSPPDRSKALQQRTAGAGFWLGTGAAVAMCVGSVFTVVGAASFADRFSRPS
jgi:hypothetical protein